MAAAGAPYRYLCYGHAAYYLVTGLWPLVSMRTFMAVTGPKNDTWLVNTAGLLISAIGTTVGLAGRRGDTSPAVATVAIGGAASLAAIDVVYASRRRISPIYLVDAAAEAGLIGLWLLLRPRAGRR
ncbi:hypothetical protein Rai3103_16635 [Raineyella fluvialis]|uniref:Uncharacterized protein n=1 Tax=Raineyella fluvialis TaxID=2662261 RepID=A0A5Q2FEB6_9ACTN|nr:hypothetical protein Rai3103_16635 [Raineyella fluvialis]